MKIPTVSFSKLPCSHIKNIFVSVISLETGRAWILFSFLHALSLEESVRRVVFRSWPWNVFTVLPNSAPRRTNASKGVMENTVMTVPINKWGAVQPWPLYWLLFNIGESLHWTKFIQQDYTFAIMYPDSNNCFCRNPLALFHASVRDRWSLTK